VSVSSSISSDCERGRIIYITMLCAPDYFALLGRSRIQWSYLDDMSWHGVVTMISKNGSCQWTFNHPRSTLHESGYDTFTRTNMLEEKNTCLPLDDDQAKHKV
jgi:hypothetical protein